MLSSGSHMLHNTTPVLMVSSSSCNRQEHRLTEAQPLVGGRLRRGLDFFFFLTALLKHNFASIMPSFNA